MERKCTLFPVLSGLNSIDEQTIITFFDLSSKRSPL